MSLGRLVTIVGLLASLSANVTIANDISVESGLNLLRASGSSINTWDVWYRVDYSWPAIVTGPFDEKKKALTIRRREPNEAVTVRSSYYRFVRDGSRVRFDTFVGSFGAIEKSAVIIDEIETVKSVSRKAFAIREEDNSSVPVGADFRDFCGMRLLGVDLELLLKSRNSLKVSRDNRGYVMFQADAEPKRIISFSRYEIRAILNPNKGLMVDEVTRSRDGQTQNKISVTEWKELGGGLFAPVQIRMSSYLPKSSEFSGEVATIADVFVDAKRSSWNKTVDQSLFRLEPGRGYRIHDSQKGILSVEGDSNLANNLDSLAGRTLKTHLRQPELKQTGTWSPLAVCSVIALCVIVAFGLYWRVRRKSL